MLKNGYGQYLLQVATARCSDAGDSTALPGVLVLEPKVFADERGFFLESFNGGGSPRRPARAVTSCRTTIRVRRAASCAACTCSSAARAGQARAGDERPGVRRRRRHRPGEPHLKRWVGIELDDVDQRQIWIPAGFAHGFLVLSDRPTCNTRRPTTTRPPRDRRPLERSHARDRLARRSTFPMSSRRRTGSRRASRPSSPDARNANYCRRFDPERGTPEPVHCCVQPLNTPARCTLTPPPPTKTPPSPCCACSRSTPSTRSGNSRASSASASARRITC